MTPFRLNHAYTLLRVLDTPSGPIQTRSESTPDSTPFISELPKVPRHSRLTSDIHSPLTPFPTFSLSCSHISPRNCLPFASCTVFRVVLIFLPPSLLFLYLRAPSLLFRLIIYPFVMSIRKTTCARSLTLLVFPRDPHAGVPPFPPFCA